MTTGTYTRHMLEVHTGHFIDYDDPAVQDVTIEDIAHALSNVCRYGGHCKRFYSVAEHSVLVHDLLMQSSARHLAFAGLLHDAHEAYLGDLPTPLKRSLGAEYKHLTTKWDRAIAELFGLDPEDLHKTPVRWADAAALRIEAHVLKQSTGVHEHWAPAWQEFGLETIPEPWLVDRIRCWSPATAKEMFLGAFDAQWARRMP